MFYACKKVLVSVYGFRMGIKFRIESYNRKKLLATCFILSSRASFIIIKYAALSHKDIRLSITQQTTYPLIAPPLFGSPYYANVIRISF